MVQSFSPPSPLFLFFPLFVPASLPIMLPAVIRSSCRPEHSAAANQRLQGRFGPFHYASACASYAIWDTGFLFLYPASPAAEGSAEASNAGGKKKKINYTTEGLQIPNPCERFILEPSRCFINFNTNWKAELSRYIGSVA